MKEKKYNIDGMELYTRQEWKEGDTHPVWKVVIILAVLGLFTYGLWIATSNLK